MSARKPLALALVICGLGATVHADPISWPSGLNNWLIYLAAPSGTAGTGPVNYTVPPPPVIAPQAVSAAPDSTPPTAVPTTAFVPPAPSQPAPSQPVSSQPVLSQPVPDQTTTYTAPAPSQPVSVQAPTYNPLAPAQPVLPQVPAYTTPASPPTSTIQPMTYIPPASSQPASVQPVTYTHANVLANAPMAVTQPAMAAQTVSSAAPASAGSVAAAPAQAFINVASGPFPQAAAITTGGAQPWYNSSQLTNLFGGQPTAQQIQSFDNAILQRVQQTFSQSGISVALTENPNTPALHTISLVSNTSAATLPSAIGMTQVGGNGFSFIDQIAPSAHSLDQLEWIAAHNISHELMLAFGVPENFDKSGNYVDSKIADWAMMVNANSSFSPDASQAITQALASQNQAGFTDQLGAQEVNPAPIPEPTTIAMWGLAAAAFVVSRRGAWRRSQAVLPAA
jgi:hypothetical protein